MPDAYIQMMSDAEMATMTVDFDEVTAETGKLQTILQEYGCAVVTNVASPEELVQLEGLWADDLKGIIVKEESDIRKVQPILQDPVYNWPLDEVSLGTKFTYKYGLAQGKLAWAVRTSPKVKRVYESIYGGNTDLCVGMDNVFFNNRRPPKAAKESDRVSDLWPHIDQNPSLQPEGNWDIFQGVLYVWGSTQDSQTTVVWPKSHKLVDRTSKTGGRSHFVRLPREMMDEFIANARRVLVPPGALLLWASKVVHQGWPHGNRLAVPVCFEPNSRRSEKALKNKRATILEGGVTTHWASLGIKHPTSHNKTEDPPEGIVLRFCAHAHLFTDHNWDTVLPKYDALL